jgi:hypothetical protein
LLHEAHLAVRVTKHHSFGLAPESCGVQAHLFHPVTVSRLSVKAAGDAFPGFSGWLKLISADSEQSQYLRQKLFLNKINTSLSGRLVHLLKEMRHEATIDTKI